MDHTVSRTLGVLPRPTAQTGFWSWVTTVDHKRIGILYGIAAFLFFLVGGIEALLIRIQLAQPQMNFLKADTFNQMFTMHATTMIFLAVMPLSSAFMNYLLPLMIGARDVAFPRLNAFSFWNFLFGGIFMNLSWFLGGAPNTGWFSYAPLTEPGFHPGMGVDFWIFGLLLLGVGTLVSGFNFLTTILNMRAPGMTLMRMPIFVWTTMVVSFLVIFSFPAITVALIMLLFDRFFQANFFATAAGGNAVFWQHLFWTFGHPEVYILILPAMGIVSEVLPTFSRKPLFGYPVVVFSSLLIGFLGFAVWSHHMFTVGMGPVVNSIFSLTTMAIAIPTGVKIFNWITTLWGGQLRFTTPMLFATAFIVTFTIGGLSGVMHASAPSDAQQQDTYFIVAHIHYVLIGGAIMALFAGMYYWYPKITGRFLNERLGKWNFWTMLVGFNMGFFPFHFLGLMGMPRRIFTYTADMGWGFWNLVSTIGVFILAVGVALFMVNFLVSMKNARVAGADPWDGRTLEWATSSPPPEYNFAVLPEVTSRDYVWELKQAPAARGQGGKAAGTRAMAPVTPPGSQLVHMPGQSYMPVSLALGLTLGSFGALYRHDTWGMTLIAIGLLVTVLSLYGWIFEGEGGHVIEVRGEQA